MSRSTSRPGSGSTEPAARGLFRLEDPASLAFFRFGFGALLLIDALRYLLGGRIARYFVEPTFHFTYFGFEWVRPWPVPALLTAHFVLLAIAAACVAVGLFYRVAAVVVFLGFAYVFLLDQALYLNHFYLIVLLALLLAVVPAHAGFSLDARRRGGSRAVPRWAIVLLRAQIGLVYFFAGVAKLNPDWLRGQPLVLWLEARRSLPIVGPLLAEDAVGLAMSWAAVALDLLAWPLLGSRRTRVATFAVLTAFHLANSVLFRIGIFPWLMIVATTIFFEPDWPRRWLALAPRAPDAPAPAAPSASRRRVVTALLVAYLAVQAFVPLRHFLYPGSVHWTEEGHLFAWHMKLRGKSSEVTFLVTDPATGESWRVDPASDLASWQVQDLGGRPDLIVQYAHRLAERARAEGRASVEVRAAALTSLNGRPARLLVDPAVDLARVERSLFPADWILGLDEPR